jgi:hypothetical protein
MSFVSFEEAEKMLPRLPKNKFTKENSGRELDLSTGTMQDMLMLDGYELVGWAYSEDVAPRHMCRYVGLFRNEDGFEAWLHFSKITLQRAAEKMQDVE